MGDIVQATCLLDRCLVLPLCVALSVFTHLDFYLDAASSDGRRNVGTSPGAATSSPSHAPNGSAVTHYVSDLLAGVDRYAHGVYPFGFCWSLK